VLLPVLLRANDLRLQVLIEQEQSYLSCLQDRLNHLQDHDKGVDRLLLLEYLWHNLSDVLRLLDVGHLQVGYVVHSTCSALEAVGQAGVTAHA